MHTPTDAPEPAVTHDRPLVTSVTVAPDRPLFVPFPPTLMSMFPVPEVRYKVLACVPLVFNENWTVSCC